MDRQFHILRGASCRDVVSSMVVVVRLMKHQREDEAGKVVLELSLPKPGGHVLSP